MIVNIDEFYNNKNWKQYVPLEAFQEEVRLVGKTLLKDVEVKNVLSITYSIDDYGESPIYIEYLDEKDQKHLVKLKPAIHEELDSVLSKYATIDCVNQKFSEAVQTSKDYTDDTKEALTIVINGSKEDAIQVSKAYTDTEINKVKNQITAGNDSVLQQAKDYANQKDNDTLVTSKNYTDTKHEEALIDIEEGDTQTLDASKNYTNSQLENYETKEVASIDHNKLSEIPNGHKNPYVNWFPDIDSNYIRMVKDGEDIRFLINNSQTSDEHQGYLSSRKPSLFALNSDIEPLSSKLQNVWGGHRAPFIYWTPNIDVNTIKLENTESDVKAKLNDADIVYWSKTPTENPVKVTTQLSETVPKLEQKEMNFIDESAGNARLMFDNTTRKYYVGVDHRLVHTKATGTTQYPVQTEDLNTMGFKVDGKIIRNTDDKNYYSRKFYFQDPFNPEPSEWLFNTSPIDGNTLAQPTLADDTIYWIQDIGLGQNTTRDWVSLNSSIEEWHMRLIDDTCGVTGWSQKLVTGTFKITASNLNLSPFINVEDPKGEIVLLFSSSIENWASRSMQIVPAEIKFTFENHPQSSAVTCFVKIYQNSLIFSNIDYIKFKKICEVVNDLQLNTKPGCIEIRINGGY